MKKTWFHALLAVALIPLAGWLSAPAAAEEAEHSADVEIVDASGEAPDIKALAKVGKTTVVDVFSEACPPCRKLSPLLDQLAARRKTLAVIKLDIGTIEKGNRRGINWQAPVLQELGIQGIPYLIIFNEKGEQALEGKAAHGQVMTWLKAAGIKE